ncbi:MAG: DUF4160 domain-containing protein [Gemmatimonadales bacterium]
MPIIADFRGITVRMYYGDHPPPHIHAEYRGDTAKYTFTGDVIAGTIRSRTARRLIDAWIRRHHDALEARWLNVEEGKALRRVEPRR